MVMRLRIYFNNFLLTLVKHDRIIKFLLRQNDRISKHLRESATLYL